MPILLFLSSCHSNPERHYVSSVTFIEYSHIAKEMVKSIRVDTISAHGDSQAYAIAYSHYRVAIETYRKAADTMRGRPAPTDFKVVDDQGRVIKYKLSKTAEESIEKNAKLFAR